MDRTVGVRGNGPVNDQEHGRDVAIIWLEPTQALGYATPRNPTFGYAKIVRPNLASPVPSGGDDSEGGDYPVPIGISGWSPTSGHDPTKRQVGGYGDIYHYPGYPGGGPGTPSGQFWVHAEAGLQIEPGDSGGPLFWQWPDGTRQVIGVAGGSLQIPFAIDGFDCTFNACDIWTDVTRGAIADWVRNQMEDRSRSPAWLDAHGRSYSWGADGTFHPDYWVGEVDYTGPATWLATATAITGTTNTTTARRPTTRTSSMVRHARRHHHRCSCRLRRRTASRGRCATTASSSAAT